MTEDQIINIFGNGQVNDAIFLAKSNGFLTLAANFEKAIKHIEDTKEYSKHYMKNNGRVAGAQVLGVGGPDFRQMKAMSHVQELGAKTLLDIGCADGSFCIFCLKNKIVENVIGIDPWIEGILWAMVGPIHAKRWIKLPPETISTWVTDTGEEIQLKTFKNGNIKLTLKETGTVIVMELYKVEKGYQYLSKCEGALYVKSADAFFEIFNPKCN